MTINSDLAPDGVGVHVTAKAWAARLSRFGKASGQRAAFELFITLAPLVILFTEALWTVRHGYWWGLLSTPLSALLLTRLFLIQHDCGHGAFFPNRKANDWVGRALAAMTLTPYGYWKRAHALHHASSGALDRRSLGGIDTLTLAEYIGLPPLRRFGYRLYRHPAVMFGLGPAFVFLVQHRWPAGMTRDGWRPWLSAMGTNGVIAGMLGVLMIAFGVANVLVVYLPVVVLAASLGVWLFFIQHQFEDGYWRRDETWEFHDAAFHGSSHYDLPQPLRWFTANIGIHHVHHLCSRIPFYRLGEVLRDQPVLSSMGRITFAESYKTVGLAVWDEAAGRLISFSAARRLSATKG